MRSFIPLVAAVVLTVAGPAFAGVVDSPLPTIAGHPTRHVFTVVGAMSNADVITTVQCTSLDAKPIRWGVEVFSYRGDQPVLVDSPRLDPGHTLRVATGSDPGAAFTVSVPLSPLPRSARIVANSNRIACSAEVRSRGSAAPGEARNLLVVRGLRQKGG